METISGASLTVCVAVQTKSGGATVAVVRKKLTLMDKVQILLDQAVCPLCGEKLGKEGIEYDHATPLALGGEDRPSNIRAVHRQCHRTKSSGKPATTAGSDIHAIAKMKRLSKEQTEFRARLMEKSAVPAFLPADHKPKRGIPSRPFPRKPKHDRRDTGSQ
jgi:hypothetical protein